MYKFQLGLTESTGDSSFEAGQLERAKYLGDPPKQSPSTFLPDWDDAYLKDIDCIILIAGDCPESIREGTAKVEHTLGHSVKQVHKVSGSARPDKGHEHFVCVFYISSYRGFVCVNSCTALQGFLDGISFPCVPGLNGPPLPGQHVVDPGVLICGHEGDDLLGSRPSWTKNGSFLA